MGLNKPPGAIFDSRTYRRPTRITRRGCLPGRATRHPVTVLAALVAAPVLFGVLLAVALAVVMAPHFGRGLISSAASG
jgi:hypothetical protein